MTSCRHTTGMRAEGHRHSHWHSVLLPPLVVIAMLFHLPPPVGGFGQGSQIQANFRLYCNRRASQRFPVHADVIRCGGLCAPQSDVRNLFTIRANASSYFSQNIQVSVTANPRSVTNNNIRGFALVAMTDNETIVGSFSEQPDALIASCDPLMEGDTAFHARASNNRRSVTLTWNPDSKNYGRVRFRTWIVVHHHTIYVKDSDHLHNEISGSGQYDVADNFYTFILQVFNISRSAATIVRHHHHRHHNDSDNDSHATDLQTTASPTVGERGDMVDDESDNHRGNSSEEDLQSGTIDGSPGSVEESGLSSAGRPAHGGSTMRTDPSRTFPRATGSLSRTMDIGGDRRIFVRRSNRTVGSLVSRFTSTVPSVGSVFRTHAGRRVNISSTTADPDNNFTSSSSRSSSSSSNPSSSKNSTARQRDSTDNSGNTGSSSNNSSTILVSISLAGGRSMTLTLPSLTSFEDAFQRRLMTTGYDVSADDPFHQLKQDVPLFRDLFPQPLPPSTLALSDTPAPSGGNPFFQAFGSSSSTSPARSNTRFSPTTRIRQTFSNLIPNVGPQTGFGSLRQSMNTVNQFNSRGGRFGQAGGGGGGGGSFPTSAALMRRHDTNTRFSGTPRDFAVRNRGDGSAFPTSGNAFQRLGSNAGIPGSQFLQQSNDRSTLGFVPGGNSVGRTDANTVFTGGNGGSLFSAIQRNPFGNAPTVNVPPLTETFSNTDLSGTRFPDTNSLLGRFSPPVRPQPNPTPGGFGQPGLFSSVGFSGRGFQQQNSGLGSLQMPNSRNSLRGQENFFSGSPTFGGNFLTGQSQRSSFLGQPNGLWDRVSSPQLFPGSNLQQGSGFRTGTLGFSNNPLGQWGTNPFGLSRTPQNNPIQSAGSRQPWNAVLNGVGNTGFQPQSASANQFAWNFPTSSRSLLGRMQNPFSSFLNQALPQNNLWNQGSGALNPFSSNGIQTGGSGSQGSFSSLTRNDWLGASSTQQNSGLLGSSAFPNRFPSSQFTLG